MFLKEYFNSNLGGTLMSIAPRRSAEPAVAVSWVGNKRYRGGPAPHGLIRVLQRRAYGYRDEEFFRLKILTCMLPKL